MKAEPQLRVWTKIENNMYVLALHEAVMYFGLSDDHVYM